MKQDKKHPLVLIEWCDAQSDGEWGSMDKIKKWAEKDCIIYDIGWIICETERYVVISSQLGKDDGEWGNRTKIPREWVRKKTKMRIK